MAGYAAPGGGWGSALQSGDQAALTFAVSVIASISSQATREQGLKVISDLVTPDLSPPKDKVLNIHDSDYEYYKQCEVQLRALQKAWDAHRIAGLSWTDVHNILRPIIEKPTAEF